MPYRNHGRLQVGGDDLGPAAQAPGGVGLPEFVAAAGLTGLLVDLVAQDAAHRRAAELPPGGLGRAWPDRSMPPSPDHNLCTALRVFPATGGLPALRSPS